MRDALHVFLVRGGERGDFGLQLIEQLEQFVTGFAGQIRRAAEGGLILSIRSWIMGGQVYSGGAGWLLRRRIRGAFRGHVGRLMCKFLFCEHEVRYMFTVHTFARTPFNDLPLLPPQARLESEPVLKAAIRASRSLAELKGRTRTVPNPTILLNTIALQEARASSEIENIFTTSDELYRSMNADSTDITPHAKEVLHYNEALWHGAERLRDVASPPTSPSRS